MWKGIPNVFCKHSPRNNIFFLFFFYQSNFKRLQFFATLVNSTLSTHLFPYSSSYLKNVERDSYSSIESNQNNTSSILLHPVKHVSMETRRSVAVGLRPLSPPDRVLSFPETVPGRPRDNRSRKDPWRIIFRTGPHRGSTAPPISFFAKIPGRLRDTRAWSRSRRKEERLVFESNYFPPETGEEEKEEKIDGEWWEVTRRSRRAWPRFLHWKRRWIFKRRLRLVWFVSSDWAIFASNDSPPTFLRSGEKCDSAANLGMFEDVWTSFNLWSNELMIVDRV